jgi:AcrR family transcriptional regulator
LFPLGLWGVLVVSPVGVSRRRRGDGAGVLSRRGDILVSQTQRSRMLNSAVAVISEHGYDEMSVSRITGTAGVSRRTFYDLFEDREDCFLAAFEEALLRARGLALAGYAQPGSWPERVRSALLDLLRFLDQEPGMRSLLILDALKAGPRVGARRVEALGELSRALHESGSRTKTARVLPPLTGEGVVGAVLGVIHTRLLAERPGAMLELLNPLMAMIVLPYLGHAAAQRELERPTPKAPRSTPKKPLLNGRAGDPLVGLPMRITHRTLLVLAAIGEHPGVSNRQVAGLAGVTDQGQISKLLARLERLGLVENTGGEQPSGEPNRWCLTPRGLQVQQAIDFKCPPSSDRGAGPSATEETV